MPIQSFLPIPLRLRIGAAARALGLLPPLPPSPEEKAAAAAALAKNPPRVIRPDAEYDPVFRRFAFTDAPAEEGFRVNGLGVRERTSYYDASAIRVWAERTRLWPPFDEEYFEWVDLLTAVAAAKGEFVMMELGAGYGPWLVNAVAALRQLSDLPYRLVAVEAEPVHFSYLTTHLADNAVDFDRCTLVEAAVSDSHEPLWFDCNDTETNYGQGVWRDEAVSERPGFRKVQSVTLGDLLEPLGHVDLIDMDIQGEEARVVSASIEDMTAKVRRVHIGTHAPDVEVSLRETFEGAGWQSLVDYRCKTEQATPWGSLYFVDGVQTWLNPSLIA